MIHAKICPFFIRNPEGKLHVCVGAFVVLFIKILFGDFLRPLNERYNNKFTDCSTISIKYTKRIRKSYLVYLSDTNGNFIISRNTICRKVTASERLVDKTTQCVSSIAAIILSLYNLLTKSYPSLTSMNLLNSEISSLQPFSL